MLKKRLIAVIIVRDGEVVQSVRFKHTNVIHYDAIHAIEAFNKWAVDEILLINVSKSFESRGQFLEVVSHVSKACFLPLTAGGWVTDEDYAQALLASGADKLLVNTCLADDPALVTALSERFGKQCILASMDIKKDQAQDQATVRVDRGNRDTEIDPVTWAKRAEKLGAGEILFNSIDHDGFRKGYDLDSLKNICAAVEVPVIAFGGVFRWKHLVEGIEVGADAVAAANIFHYTEHSTRKAKRFMADAGILVRLEGQSK